MVIGDHSRFAGDPPINVLLIESWGRAMQFDWRQRIGRIGERRVASFVEEKLKFGYRKVGEPDIGVDGEIEIADENLKSTGGLLKVQVKATAESFKGRASLRIPIDEKHLDYFASLMVQPILAVVSIKDDVILWKPILHKNHCKGPRSGFGITLHSKADRLTKRSARFLKMLGERSNAIIAKYIIEEAEELLSDMDSQFSTGEYDTITADIWSETLASVQSSLRDARCLLLYERRHSDEIKKTDERFDEVVGRVQNWRRWFIENHFEDKLVEQASRDDYFR
ncbi:DUF4365 domain-containing protein [Rhodopseudomonas parapalustris]